MFIVNVYDFVIYTLTPSSEIWTYVQKISVCGDAAQNASLLTHMFTKQNYGLIDVCIYYSVARQGVFLSTISYVQIFHSLILSPIVG